MSIPWHYIRSMLKEVLLESLQQAMITVAVPRLTPIVREYTGYTVEPSGSLRIDIPGAGVVDEVLVVSRSGSFKLTITVGGVTVWDKSWGEASRLSDNLVFLSAFQDENGLYVYHIAGIPFSNGVSVEVVNLDPVNPITFEHIIVKGGVG